MKVDRKRLFATVRGSLFGGKLRQEQVDGIECILDECEQRGITDTRWIAYILGTTYHETAKTMQPIEEYGKGRGRAYGKPHPRTGKIYYGRGFVQITWYDNYYKMERILNIPLTAKPELALDPKIAAKIIVEGMTRGESFDGDFTGHHLGMYFNDEDTDWVGARRIVNGLDRANDIATYSQKFHRALVLVPDDRVPPTTVVNDGVSEKTAAVWAFLAALAAAAGTVLYNIFGG